MKKTRFHLFDTLRKKLIFCSLLLTACLVVPLYFASSSVFFQNIYEDYANYELNAFSQTSNYLKMYLESLDDIIDKVYFSQTLTSAFSEELDEEDLPSVLERVGAVEEELKHFLFSTQELDYVVFLGKNDLPYLYQASLKSGQYAGADFDFAGFLEDAGLPEEGMPSFYLHNPPLDASPSVKLVNDTISGNLLYWRMLRSQTGEPELAVLCVFHPKILQESYPMEGGLSKLSLVDKDHKLAYNFSTRHFYRDEQEGDPYGVAKGYAYRDRGGQNTLEMHHTMSASNLTLVGRVPVSALRRHYGGTAGWTWAFAGLCFLLVLLLSAFLSKRITGPLHALSENLLAYSRDIEHPGEGKRLQIGRAKLFHKYRLRTQMMFYFLISTLLPCCLFVCCLFFSYVSLYTDNLTQLTANTVSQARRNIDYRVKTFDDFTTDLIYGDPIQNIFNKLAYTELSEEDYTRVKQLVMDTKYSRRDILALQLYDKKGRALFADNGMGEEIEPEILQALDGSNGNLTYIGADSTSSMEPALQFARLIHNVYHPNLASPAGYLSISTSHDLLNSILQDIKPTSLGYCFAIDEKQSLISHYNINLTDDLMRREDPSLAFLRDDKGSFASSLRGEQYLILHEKSQRSDLAVAAVIPYSDIHQHAYPILKYAALLLLLCVIVVVVFSTIISLKSTAPLIELQTLMGKVSGDELDVAAGYRGVDEIGVLCEQFNQMTARLNTLIKDNYQAKIRESNLETLEKEAQISALQQQINPHFLYNTLETIKWMAYEKGARDICDMVTALGKFFRGSISKQNGLISFEQEIEHLKTYLYIQEIRYCGKFDVIWKVSPEVLQKKTVKLILQPLVENAILHGMEEMESGGHIILRMREEDGHILCVVEDNGSGMTPERLRELTDSLHTESKGTGSIGVSNVYRRLHLYFGEDFSFQIESKPGEGTRILFRIPSIS